MKRFIIPALVLAPLALAGVAIAASGGPGSECGGPMHHRGGPPIGMIAGALELDEAQTADLEGLAEGVHEGFASRRDAHDGFRESAAAELLAKDPNFDRLVAEASAEAEAMHSQHLDTIQAVADFAATLTPEQRAKLAAHLEEGPPHHRGGHFKGHHGH